MGMNLSTEQKEVLMNIIIKQNKIVKASEMFVKAYPSYATLTEILFRQYWIQSLGEIRVSYQLVFIPEPIKIKCLDQKYLELRKLSWK